MQNLKRSLKICSFFISIKKLQRSSLNLQKTYKDSKFSKMFTKILKRSLETFSLFTSIKKYQKVFDGSHKYFERFFTFERSLFKFFQRTFEIFLKTSAWEFKIRQLGKICVVLLCCFF